MKTSNNLIQTDHSRRDFLKVSGGLTLGIVANSFLPGCTPGINEVDPAYVPLSAWVQIAADNSVRIFSPAAEMGQGSMTALAAIIAEEMDADWSLVSAEHSPVDPLTFGLTWGGDLGGSMLTVGSRTVRGYYKNLRIAGAQVRKIILDAASAQMDVPLDELSTKNSEVIHTASGKKLAYGEIVSNFAPPAEAPDVSEEDLKKPSEFTIIGTDLGRHDIPEKVDGSAMYSMDIHLPGLVYGVITRSPAHGAVPSLQNTEKIEVEKGLIDIVTLDHGIGVIAETVEDALRIKAGLEISWDRTDASTHNSDEELFAYDKIASARRYQGADVLDSQGDVDNSLRQAHRRFRRDYLNDYVYHCQMEPLNAVVSIAEDGLSAEVWAGSQFTDGARSAAAEALDLPLEQVTFHPCYLGGGFGRRSLSDYVTEACSLAMAAGGPLKLIWTREDDLGYGHLRPQSLQQMEAGLDVSGKIVSWKHTVVGTGAGLLGSGARIPFYDIPNKHIEIRSLEHKVRTKHWRAVGHGPNKYAIEAFIDEIAYDLGKDPLSYRMDMMEKNGRPAKVLQKVAEMSSWGSPAPSGRAKGIAFAERSGSLSAGACEISVDRESGQIHIHHFWAAVDAGVVVDPNNVIAQMEGAIIMGISSIIKERVSFRNGEIVESNYHDYPILRMNEIPDHIEVAIINSDEAPTGVGESGLPIVGGAVANAFLWLTGKSLRHMPFTPAKVSTILA
jgi:isoquinoline 1-oxidoreductase beta subunit